MLWLAMHFPRLPLEVFAAHKTDRAFVVLDNNRVCARNVAARAAGIELGTTLATAHSICPQLAHRHKDPALETRGLITLANTLYRFSSQVCLHAPDCVLLEIGGSLRLFGSHQDLQAAAEQLCATLDHQCTTRVATTPWAAIALARSQQQDLRQVPLAQMGLPGANIEPRIIERLENMGIHTLGPLLDLPVKQVGRRFGKHLLKLIGQLTGALPDPRQAITPAADFKQQIHLLQPITNKADLHHSVHSPMHTLATELHQWLISHQLGCEQLHWQFSSHNKVTVSMPLRFAQPRQSCADILRMAELKLQQLELPAEVLSIGLSTTRLTPWTNDSQTLFQLHHNPQADSGDMAQLIDELHAKFGDNTCYGIAAQPQHTPECAWGPHTTLQATARTPRPSAADNDSITLPRPGNRPLWLFDQPRQVARNELQLLHGPERIQSNWWQTATCRDYYIARHRLGAECWAFVEGDSQWYLHGYFG